jgi:hypothetical protein
VANELLFAVCRLVNGSVTGTHMSTIIRTIHEDQPYVRIPKTGIKQSGPHVVCLVEDVGGGTGVGSRHRPVSDVREINAGDTLDIDVTDVFRAYFPSSGMRLAVAVDDIDQLAQEMLDMVRDKE